MTRRFSISLPLVSTVSTLLLLLPSALFAQITGTVLDPQGAAIPRAVVYLSGAASSRTVGADADGRFRFESPADGTYTLLASAPGLSGAPQKIRVKGGAVHADLRLQLAARSEVLVVTAERAELPTSAVASSTTVLTRDQLEEMHAENVAQALRHVPGLAVVQTGRRGSVTSVFARGGDSNFNLVMVDSVRVNDFGGAFNFAHLPVEIIDRIEVVRGPQSALYGLNAIGSVVHIITRRATSPFQFHGEAEGGSFATARGSFGAGGRAGRFGWNFDLVRHSSDGVVPNDDYLNRAGSLNLEYEPTAASRIRYTLVAGANESGVPGPFRVAPVNRVSRLRENSLVNGLEFEFTRGRFHQKLTGSFYTDRRDFTSSFGTSLSRQFHGGFGTETRVALAEDDTLSFGFDYQRERFRNTFITDERGSDFPLFRNNFGWFVENLYEHDGRLFLSTGFRLENIRTSALPADAFGIRPAIDAHSRLALSPKVSVAYLLGPGRATKLHGSAGTGLRAPGGFELTFTNNPELAPERTTSFDLGIQQELAQRRVVLDLTYFYNRYHDLIVTLRGDLSELSSWQSDNLANSRAQGLELSGAFRPTGWINFSGHYTWLKSEVLSLDGAPGRGPTPFRVGQRLLRRPAHSGAYLATWRIKRLRLKLNTGAFWRSETLDADPILGPSGGLLINPGYVRPDLGAEIALSPEVALFGRLYNFSDSRYEEALGFPALRRNFVAGLKFRWRK